MRREFWARTGWATAGAFEQRNAVPRAGALRRAPLVTVFVGLQQALPLPCLETRKWGFCFGERCSGEYASHYTTQRQMRRSGPGPCGCGLSTNFLPRVSCLPHAPSRESDTVRLRAWE